MAFEDQTSEQLWCSGGGSGSGTIQPLPLCSPFASAAVQKG